MALAALPVLASGAMPEASFTLGAAGGDSALWLENEHIVRAPNAIIRVGDDGYLRMTGGSLTLGTSDTAAGLYLNSASQIHLENAAVNCSVESKALYNAVIMENRSTDASDFYMDGGMLSVERRITMMYANGVAARTSFTLDHDAHVSCACFAMGHYAGGAQNVFALNLNGGVLEPRDGIGNGAGMGNGAENFVGAAFVNLNGGTLKFPTAVPASTRMMSKCALVVYPKGGVIECDEDVNLYAQIRHAEGYGVGAVTLTDAGAGYTVPPKVTLDGGSGSNATAIAVLKKDGSLARVVVTCPGEGYAADDVVTARFSSGGASATVTLAENTKPTLVKRGAGMLWIQNSAYTFNGNFLIEGGQSTRGYLMDATVIFKAKDETRALR